MIERGNELVELAGFLRSHARIAHLVASSSLGKLIHVAGLGWFAWNGRYFVEDEEAKRATVAVMEAIRQLAPNALGDAEMLADLRQSQTANGIARVLKLMGSLDGIRAGVR